MKNVKVAGIFFVSILVVALVGGCGGTKQARKVKQKEGVFFDYSLLEKGKDDAALLRYQNPDADIISYTKVMIDPVVIEKPSHASEKQLADFQRLATNFYIYLHEELKKDYALVDEHEPGTLRIETALMDADRSGPALEVITSILPIGIGLSVTKNFATGKPAGVGELSMEMKITDASTGELLGAAVDRRVGRKGVKGIFDTWDDANAAAQYWAKRLRYVLCLERGGIECEKP